MLAEFVVVYLESEPISINAAYTTVRGRRMLTTEGKAFKANLAAAVARELPIDWGKLADRVYSEAAWVELEVGIHRNIRVASWKPGAREKRQMPYQRMDGSNYLKLIEDAVVHATGIDDSAHLDVRVVKAQSDENFISIRYRLMENRHGQ